MSTVAPKLIYRVRNVHKILRITADSDDRSSVLVLVQLGQYLSQRVIRSISAELSSVFLLEIFELEQRFNVVAFADEYDG